MSDPLILIVGNDAVARRVFDELTAIVGHRVRVVDSLDADLPETAYVDAGVLEAASLLALTEDDGRNLAVALRARSLNPQIRIVLRQRNVSSYLIPVGG